MFLLFVFLNKFSAYSINDTLQLKHIADSLFYSKNYYHAAIYYQKLEFFLQSESLKNEARLLAANSYKLNKNYNVAISHLNSIILNEASDSLIFKVKYQSALMSYLNGNLTVADSYLTQLNYLIKDSSFILSSLLLHAFVLNEQYKWAKAKEKLELLNKHLFISDTLKYNQIKQLLDSSYDIKNIPKLKNVDKAVKMSTFFPGLGQCYVKNYAEGITSFLALTVIAGGMVVGIFYQYYFTAIFTGNLLIAKFYLGGIKRAEFLAEMYNYKLSKGYNLTLKSKIKQHFIN